MMNEISLNILDITENSVRARASLIEITVKILNNENLLSIEIKDNGCGMTDEQKEHVIDPFFTTRKTRDVGLGVPFLKMAAELTGGSFSITSELNVGTTINANFVLSHVDRMPLGDINTTIYSLIVANNNIDFVYNYTFDKKFFTLDTREFRKILGDIPFNNPEVSSFIRKFLMENKEETDGGKIV